MTTPQEVFSANKRQDCARKAACNVTRKLLTEFQTVLAFACYDSPSICTGCVSMTEDSQEQLLAKLCLGDNDGDDPNLISYVDDQFLGGLNKFQGLFTEDVNVTASNGETILTMLPSLHRQSSIHIYVGKGSIDKSLLLRKRLINATGIINGRTLLRLAKEVISNCKKIMALVMACNSPYKDGTFPSGTNWDDYANWCLAAYYTSENHASSLATSTIIDPHALPAAKS